MTTSISQTPDLYSIYTLVDRRDMTVHYVGMSKQPYQRYGQHLILQDNNVAKNTWILEMTGQGYLPLLEILEQVDGFQYAKQREAHWISIYLALGMPLANIQQSLNQTSDEGPVHSSLERICFALEALQAMSEQLSKQIVLLQEEVSTLKSQRDVEVGNLRRAYIKIADRALKRHRKPVKLQQTLGEKILAQLKKLPSPTVREIAHLVHLDTETVREELQALIKSGIVEEVHAGKTFRYRFAAN